MFAKMSVQPTPATPLTSPVPQTLLSGDEVVQLRVWASDRVYPLPCDAERRLLIGTAPECVIRMEDPSNRVSRRHAYLQRDGARWHIVDQSSNGLFLDGTQLEKGFLLAGMRVGIGSRVTLVAESERTIELRADRVYEVYILDKMLSRVMLAISELYTDQDVGKLALQDFENYGEGRFNTILTVRLEKVTGSFLALPPDQRYREVMVEDHRLEESVLTILGDVDVPQYERL